MAGDFVESMVLNRGLVTALAGGTFDDSIAIALGSVTLVNDAASPGNSKYYSTSSGGTKGWHALPAFGVNIGGTVGGSPTDYGLLLVDGFSNVGQVSGLGSAGDVMTSNGPGALPTWQAAAGGGGISIGDPVGGSPTNYELLTVDGSGNVAQIPSVSAGYVLTDNGSSALPTFQAVPGSTGANPTALVGLSAVNGSAATFMRSDGAPALDVAIAPTWTGVHIWNQSGNQALKVDGNGSVQAGLPSISTSATDGFLYVEACAGTPTGTPTSVAGMVPVVIDSTGNVLYFYSGGAWQSAGGGGGGGGMAIGGAISGSPTNYGLLLADGSGNLGQPSGLGSAGDVMTSNGGGALPTWQAGPSGMAIGSTIGGSPINNAVLLADATGKLADNAYLLFTPSSKELVVGGLGLGTSMCTLNAGGNDGVLCHDATNTYQAWLGSGSFGTAARFYDGTNTALLCFNTAAARFTDGARAVSVSLCDGTNTIGYTPGNTANWTGTPPTDVWVALDRCAALLQSLNAGTGP